MALEGVAFDAPISPPVPETLERVHDVMLP
jgi:hypothetical protein